LPHWLVCQIGARENYAVARALARCGALAGLLTDAWVVPENPLARLSSRLGERFHPELARELVAAPSAAAVAREAADRLTGRSGWPQIIARNAWFQRATVRRLKRLWRQGPAVVFAYSYAAAEILAFAKARGALAILGQIDPGPVEARLVDELYAEAGEPHEPIPSVYWDCWRRETELADIIIVNSAWSRDGLLTEGVPAEKIRIVALAYEGPSERTTWTPPASFTAERPLKFLFLGQVTRRKGIDLLFDALARIPDAPIQLDVVGPLQVKVPETARADPRIILHGAVSRSEVGAFYAAADVFVFPTRSDGFGLTQLEAMAAGVPVLASRCCGEVVSDGVDGILAADLDPQALASTFATLAADPRHITSLRANVHLSPDFSLNKLAEDLEAITRDLIAAKCHTRVWHLHKTDDHLRLPAGSERRGAA
jgi:glycosyltransferase involved in cell wall biosynthesis